MTGESVTSPGYSAALLLRITPGPMGATSSAAAATTASGVDGWGVLTRTRSVRGFPSSVSILGVVS